MLVKDPARRASVEKVWEHPWMKDCQLLRRDHRRDEAALASSKAEAAISKLEEFGFPASMIRSSIEANSMNHLTATYLLLAQA